MKALDRIDYKIVRLLRNNARLSNKELAEAVGLAPSTCLVRTRMLQQSGVLTGFKAEVNPAALGVGLQAMISVRLKRHYKPDVEAFRQASKNWKPTGGAIFLMTEAILAPLVGLQGFDCCSRMVSTSGVTVA